MRPMEASLRTPTTPAPARKKPTTTPPPRREQPKETLPSCTRIEVEKVAKAPLEVVEEANDDRFVEVHDTKDAHNDVDIRQDVAVDRLPDDVQAGGRAEQDQERLVEAAPDVKDNNEGFSRPRRVPKPNSRYSPEDYDLDYVKAAKKDMRRSSP